MKIDLRKIGFEGMDWIQTAQDTMQRRVVMGKWVHFWVS